VDDFVRVANSPALEPSTITVDAWVKSSGPGQFAYILSKGANACIASSYALYTGGSGGLFFYISPDGVNFVLSPDAGTGVWDGNWHHVAGTFNGSTVRLYVDGAEVAAGTPTGISIGYGLSPTNDLFLGRFNGTCILSFQGEVDEVEIYSRALDASEILAIFNAGSAGKCINCVPPPLDLVSWWPGDGNPNDIADNNPGTLVGGVTYATGQVGQGFNLPGSAATPSRVEAADAANLDITGPITLDAWVNFAAVSPQTPGISNSPIVAKWGDTTFGTAGYGLFVKADGTPFLAVSSTGFDVVAVFSPTPLPPGSFAHVAGVWTGTQLELYVNGVLKATTLFTGPIFANNIPVLVGGYNPALTNGPDSMVGVIDEVEIFNRALSQSEIQAIVHADREGKCKVITADIDIKPGSFPNSINPKSKGKIPVAILSSATFNAVTQVDQGSLTFGHIGNELSLAFCNSNGEDVNGDTLLDLVCHFHTQTAAFESGDTQGILKGKTVGDIPIIGTDSVRIVPAN
jgi:hypothetical protein